MIKSLLDSKASTEALNTALMNYASTSLLEKSLALKADITSLENYVYEIKKILSVKADINTLASYATNDALT